MNITVLKGRLTSAPEVRNAKDMNVARFTLAVDRRKKKEEGEQSADFIRCVAFGHTADFITNYFGKGSEMLLNGHIQTGSYKKDDGTTVYTTDVIVDAVEFCGKKSDSTTTPPEVDADGFMNIPEGIDEELPFAMPSAR